MSIIFLLNYIPMRINLKWQSYLLQNEWRMIVFAFHIAPPVCFHYALNIGCVVISITFYNKIIKVSNEIYSTY